MMTQEPSLSPNASRTLEARYLQKDAAGNIIETPADMFRRVAASVAAAEARYGASEPQVQHAAEEFYDAMASTKFLPNSPTLMNAGRPLGMLSACFVLPVDDSIEGIFDSVKHTAQIQKAGGGTGFSFDRLRPTGDYIASSGGRTSGPDQLLARLLRGHPGHPAGRVPPRGQHGHDVRRRTRTSSSSSRPRTTRPRSRTSTSPSRSPTRSWAAARRAATRRTSWSTRARAGGTACRAGLDIAQLHAAGPAAGRAAAADGRATRVRDVWDLIVQQRLGHRRAGPVLHRPHQRRQPHAAPGPHRGDQPLRRAAAAGLRGVQPGLDRPVEVRPRRRGWTRPAFARDDPPGRAVPGRRDRREQLRHPADRRASAGQPQDRPGHHGPGRRDVRAGHQVRQRRGAGLRPPHRGDADARRPSPPARSWPAQRGSFPNWTRQPAGTRSTTGRCGTPPSPPSPRPAR